MITYKKLKDYYYWGKRFLKDPYHITTKQLNQKEGIKSPRRSEIINYLIKSLGRQDITYLEIGVRNPADNYNKIIASRKYSVDPGVEFEENPVDFKRSSDDFFSKFKQGEILSLDTHFDVIFIDGLHLAEQVDRDIQNALEFIKDDGFIALHDCNPPTESHAREEYAYQISPAMNCWNGTTWKAFYKVRQRQDIFSCCVDSDWGVGIISKTVNLGNPTTSVNPFFEFKILDQTRNESLNLISFEQLNAIIDSNSLLPKTGI